MVDIINALDCTADELPCMEAEVARPRFDSWLGELVANCDAAEIKLITDMEISMKASLRRLKITGQ